MLEMLMLLNDKDAGKLEHIFFKKKVEAVSYFFLLYFYHIVDFLTNVS